MSTSDAWLLDCAESLSIAVGDHELVELVQTGQRRQMPASPDHEPNVLLWQEREIPVMELGLLHNGARQEWPDSYLCVLNYQASPVTRVQQLALRVRRAPERIQVDDAQLCEFPREYDDSPLKTVTLSCFTHDANPVLIINIASLCSPELQDMASNG